MAAKTLSSKIVVTNRSALQGKYGTSGVGDIEKAVKVLVAADAKRGLATRLVYLDSPALGAVRVVDPADPTENKAAIDGLVKKHRPEYLVILGSHDVVPYQGLRNKLYDPADPESDPDEFVGSDLPYACDAPYSQDVTRFLGPTRVVGRIPDLTRAATPGAPKSPAYLVAQLKAIAAAATRSRPQSAFALSAKVWTKSTKMSVRNILGGAPVVKISPKDGPKFTKAQLQEKVHFVNCHGDTLDPTFSGEGPKDRYATAMDARKLAGVSVGTVAAFECCYGAELYDPTGLPSMSIANVYLAKRAAGVLASTTIAYGPEDDNANADVLCQVFIEQTLRGASLGRALLESRLAYVRGQSVVDPYDEKTLAQFVLLGDPSLHPFSDAAKPNAKASPSEQAVEHAARLQRRVRLTKTGERLSRESSYTVPARSAAAAGALRSKGLASAMKRFKRLRMFQVHEPKAARLVSSKALKEMPKATRVFVATRRRKPATTGAKERQIFDGLLAYQVNGQLVTRSLVSR